MVVKKDSPMGSNNDALNGSKAFEKSMSSPDMDSTTEPQKDVPQLPIDPKAILHPHHLRRARMFGAAFLLVASMSLGFFGGWIGARNDKGAASMATSTQKEVVLSESQLVANIAKDVGPSVVSVNVTGQTTTTDLFGFAQSQQEQSAGTGIILSADGVIVTNRHVVPAGTTSVSVTLSDGTTYNNVQVIGRTNASDSLDVAFLKIANTRGKRLVPAMLGDSSAMKIGDRVVAIGNALGQFQNTVTSGILSGYGRSLQASDAGGAGSSENLEDLFQTDAAINEGNSGGPLVNADGQVIGLNTAVASGAQGIGFAIPINDISGLIKTVLATGKFEQPYLGVHYLSLTNDYAQQLGLSITRGAYVIPSGQDGGQPGVVAGSPAAKSGLKEKDVITAVDGTNIDANHSLTSLLDRHSVGDSVTLVVQRSGKQLTISAQLGQAPSS